VPAKIVLPQGLEPPAKPPAKPAPKLPNLVPNPQPRVQPNLLPRWQPSLLLESPFLWARLSMCSSSESNTPARKKGTQSLFLRRAEHASRQAVILWCICPCICVTCFVLHILCIVIRRMREASLGVCSLRGARIPSRAGGYCASGGGGTQFHYYFALLHRCLEAPGSFPLGYYDTLMETCTTKTAKFWIQSLHTLRHRSTQVLTNVTAQLLTENWSCVDELFWAAATVHHFASPQKAFTALELRKLLTQTGPACPTRPQPLRLRVVMTVLPGPWWQTTFSPQC
jgi:hypothetical protein